VCNCGQKHRIRKSVIAQNREENRRKERKRREERICLAYFEGAAEEAIFTVSGAVSGEGKKQYMWCRVHS